MTSKSERTRSRILAAALELFGERGYDSTTVAHIAAAAGVSEMTFFRYFPARENLLIDDPFDPRIAAAIGNQRIDRGALVRVVRGIREAWLNLPPADTDEVRARLRIAAASPALRASMMRNTAATENAIVSALADVDPITARIVAAAVLAALTTALLEWGASDSGELREAIHSALDALDSSRG